MRKIKSTVLCALLACTTALASTPVTFVVNKFDPRPIGNHTPKSPILPPTVYLDDRTLTFTADHPEYVLSVRNEEDEVVYTTVVSPSQTQVTLPSTLSGEYQIQLTMGNWMFTGWITLC